MAILNAGGPVTKADHFHIFWVCSIILRYWTVKGDEVMNTSIPMSFETMYLVIVDTLSLKRWEDYKMLRILLLAGKKRNYQMMANRFEVQNG